MILTCVVFVGWEVFDKPGVVGALEVADGPEVAFCSVASVDDSVTVTLDLSVEAEGKVGPGVGVLELAALRTTLWLLLNISSAYGPKPSTISYLTKIKILLPASGYFIDSYIYY